jgi:hypothetical protein
MQKKRVRSKLKLAKETLLSLTEMGQAAGAVATALCTSKPILCTSKCPTQTAVAPGGECCA